MSNSDSTGKNGSQSSDTTQFSWLDVGPREHFVQFYESDEFLVECVADYLATGLAAKENALVIATEGRQRAIADALRRRNVDVGAVTQRCQYLPFDAADSLSAFMLDGMPDEARFTQVVSGMFRCTTSHGKGMRVFGEMVALLLKARNTRAAMRLEEMWNHLAGKHEFSLFCAYPTKAFDPVVDAVPFQHICKEHSRVLPGKPDVGGFYPAIPSLA